MSAALVAAVIRRASGRGIVEAAQFASRVSPKRRMMDDGRSNGRHITKKPIEIIILITDDLFEQEKKKKEKNESSRNEGGIPPRSSSLRTAGARATGGQDARRSCTTRRLDNPPSPALSQRS